MKIGDLVKMRDGEVPGIVVKCGTRETSCGFRYRIAYVAWINNQFSNEWTKDLKVLS
jgi:hypothetical protein